MKDRFKTPSYNSYFAGFVLSIALTMAAYVPVAQHVNSHHEAYSHHFLTVFVIVLAIVQLYVQLYFFLHLGKESKPRWRTMAFAFALLVVLIVVIGSLWIMNNLNYRMTPQQMDKYMRQQDGGI